MWSVKRWVAAALVAAGLAAPADAQQRGGTTGTTGTTTAIPSINTGSGTGGITAGQTGSIGGSNLNSSFGNTGIGGNTGVVGGGTGVGGNTGFGNNQFGNTGFGNNNQFGSTGFATPALGGRTGTGGASASNIFASYYQNPYAGGATSGGRVGGGGGFGSPLYGNTSTGGAGLGGRTGTTGFGGTGTTGFGGTGTTGFGGTGTTGFGGTTGLGGRTGGFGGTGGLGGTNQSGILIPPPSQQMAYVAQIGFPAPPVAPTTIQTELRGVVDNLPGLTTPQNVQLVVSGNTVVLRGTVTDADEARLIESVVRLTPGVYKVENQLQFPNARK